MFAVLDATLCLMEQIFVKSWFELVKMDSDVAQGKIRWFYFPGIAFFREHFKLAFPKLRLFKYFGIKVLK